MDKPALVAHYTAWAPQMQNLDQFYEWLLREIERAGVSPDARVLDVGCGTGELLARLAACGYRHLTGIDFSPGCLRLAHEALQGYDADLVEHDIEEEPLAQTFDLVLMTTVIDFLVNPAIALDHARVMVAADGMLIVTIRNRWAYWPWYHLKPIVMWRRWPQRVAHWLQWFSLPLPMRRTDQPYERIYAPPEMRQLLRAHGFHIVSERAALYLPMLHIPGTGRFGRFMNTLDRTLQGGPALPLAYEYMFVCRASHVSSYDPNRDGGATR